MQKTTKKSSNNPETTTKSQDFRPNDTKPFSVKVLENVPVDSLKDNPENPRTDHDVRTICQSIETMGFVNYPIVDEGMTLLAGHGRKKALKKLGWETCPKVVQINGLTPEQKRAYLIADNQLVINGKWDNDKLEALMTEKVLSVFPSLKWPKISVKEPKIEAIYPIEQRFLDTEWNFMIVVFDSKIDFQFASELMGLEKVRNWKETEVGLKRFVLWKDWVEKCKQL
jgi:hypothetical protein